MSGSEPTSGSEIDQAGRQFLLQLFRQTRGDSSIQVSMYDIGAGMGLDRSTAARVAEELIALQLVEIRTLSGGIGISPGGVEEVQSLLGDQSPAGHGAVRFGDDPVLDQAGCRLVEQVIGRIRNQVGSLGLDFNTLSEVMADMKTIDAQLGSSRPKSAILKECLRSLKSGLGKAGDTESLAAISELLSG
jgi:hypothetical protein